MSTCEPGSRCPCSFRAKLTLLVAVSALALSPIVADAQQPTPQQQSAIRASCRSDFQANCAGVPTGGAEALNCLKQNAAKVSPPCQQALAAVGGGASAPTAGAMPAPAMQPPAAAPMQPPGGGMGQGMGQAPMGQGMGMSGGGRPPPTMREEMMLTREMCGPEFRQFCPNVQLGGGRAMQCLEANAPSLSPGCRQALMQMRQR